MELFIRQSLALSALCRLHYSPLLCLGDNICLLFPALLPACCSAGDGPGLWRFIILSEGLLDKEPNIPLCASEIWLQEMRKMSEDLTATICPVPSPPPG